MTKNLTVGPPLRLIVMFAIPLLIGTLFQQAYAITDAVVVGRLLGVDALAAVGASSSLQFLLVGFAMGVAAGVAIPVARAFGSGDLAAMRRAVVAGLWISLGVAAMTTVVGTLGAPVLLSWMGTPPELIDQSATFLAVLFSGGAATMAFNFLSAVIRALGDSRTPLLFLIVASLINAALVVLFVGGLHLGVGAAAAATVLSQAVSVVLCIVLIARRMPALWLTRADWRVSAAEVRTSAALGLSMGFQMSVIAVGAAILQVGVNGLGTDAVAAYTAAMRVDQAGVIPLASVGVAISTFVAQNRGAQQWRRIREGVFRTSVASSLFALVLGAVIITFGTQLAGVFVGDHQERIVAMAHQYLTAGASLYVLLAILFVIRSSIQGLGATVMPTLAGVMELVARGLASVVLIGQLGFLGVAVASPLAWIFALVPLTISWVLRRRRMLDAEDELDLRTLSVQPAPALA